MFRHFILSKFNLKWTLYTKVVYSLFIDSIWFHYYSAYQTHKLDIFEQPILDLYWLRHNIFNNEISPDAYKMYLEFLDLSRTTWL